MSLSEQVRTQGESADLSYSLNRSTVSLAAPLMSLKHEQSIMSHLQPNKDTTKKYINLGPHLDLCYLRTCHCSTLPRNHANSLSHCVCLNIGEAICKCLLGHLVRERLAQTQYLEVDSVNMVSPGGLEICCQEFPTFCKVSAVLRHHQMQHFFEPI